MKSKNLFFGLGLILTLGLVACGPKTPESKESVESKVSSKDSGKSSNSSKSSTSKTSVSTEPEPVIDSELFCEENGTWLNEKFDQLYYWNDQNWCGSYTEMKRAELTSDGVYHYAWETTDGACDYSAQFFYNVKDLVPGERYVAMFDLVASDAVTGDAFTIVYVADDADRNPGLEKGLNKIRYTFVQSERPQSSTDYFGASISFHFSEAAASGKTFSIDVSNIRIYTEAEAPEELDPPVIPEGHEHDLAAVAHDKGAGEIAEEIKKCKHGPYYEISFNYNTEGYAKDDESTESGGGLKLKTNGVSYVTYNVYSPVALRGRLWIDISGNTANQYNRANEVSSSNANALWYDYASGEEGFKYQITVDGEEVKFENATYKVGDEDIGYDKLTYSDFGTLHSNASSGTVEVPTPEFELKAGVNQIKILRLTGYAFNFVKFTFKGLGNGTIDEGGEGEDDVTTLPALNVMLYKRFITEDQSAALKTAFESFLAEQKVAITSLVWNLDCEGVVADLDSYVSTYDGAHAEAKFDILLGGKAFANCDYLNGNFSAVMNGDAAAEMTIGDKTDRRVWVANESPNFAAVKLLVKNLLNIDLADPEPAADPLPSNGIALKAGEQVKFEAELAKDTNWKASGWSTFVGDDADANASGGKFITASTGDQSKAGYFEIVIDAPSAGKVTMKAAYCRGGKNAKTATIDYSYVYQYRLDEAGSQFTCKTENHTDSKVASWDWVEIEFEFDVTAGRHTIKGFLDSNNSTTNAGCPCVDYFLFTLAAE